MRIAAKTLVIASFVLVFCPRITGQPPTGAPPDMQALGSLQAKADAAAPKDRCFLHAKLVYQMTSLAGSQLSSGRSADASQTLALVKQYTEKIRGEMASDSKKLKEAELLMENASFKLHGVFDSASYEDRAAMQATLQDLDSVQTELLMNVFKR